MNEQGLGGFGGGRGGMQGHGWEVMALLQHHHQRRRQLEEEEEVRRQMFAGVAAFLVALGHGQQVDYGEDAGGSEPEPPPERTHGGSGSKRSRAAEVHNLSEKVVPLPFLEMTDFFFLAVLCFLLSASAKDRCLVLLAFGRRGGGARSTRR
jgi:hypothetical protein